jgi:hypothetical protein
MSKKKRTREQERAMFARLLREQRLVRFRKHRKKKLNQPRPKPRGKLNLVVKNTSITRHGKVYTLFPGSVLGGHAGKNVFSLRVEKQASVESRLRRAKAAIERRRRKEIQIAKMPVHERAFFNYAGTPETIVGERRTRKVRGGKQYFLLARRGNVRILIRRPALDSAGRFDKRFKRNKPKVLPFRRRKK